MEEKGLILSDIKHDDIDGTEEELDEVVNITRKCSLIPNNTFKFRLYLEAHKNQLHEFHQVFNVGRKPTAKVHRKKSWGTLVTQAQERAQIITPTEEEIASYETGEHGHRVANNHHRKIRTWRGLLPYVRQLHNSKDVDEAQRLQEIVKEIQQHKASKKNREAELEKLQERRLKPNLDLKTSQPGDHEKELAISGQENREAELEKLQQERLSTTNLDLQTSQLGEIVKELEPCDREKELVKELEEINMVLTNHEQAKQQLEEQAQRDEIRKKENESPQMTPEHHQAKVDQFFKERHITRKAEVSGRYLAASTIAAAARHWKTRFYRTRDAVSLIQRSWRLYLNNTLAAKAAAEAALMAICAALLARHLCEKARKCYNAALLHSIHCKAQRRPIDAENAKRAHALSEMSKWWKEPAVGKGNLPGKASVDLSLAHASSLQQAPTFQGNSTTHLMRVDKTGSNQTLRTLRTGQQQGTAINFSRAHTERERMCLPHVQMKSQMKRPHTHANTRNARNTSTSTSTRARLKSKSKSKSPTVHAVPTRTRKVHRLTQSGTELYTRLPDAMRMLQQVQQMQKMQSTGPVRARRQNASHTRTLRTADSRLSKSVSDLMPLTTKPPLLSATDSLPVIGARRWPPSKVGLPAGVDEGAGVKLSLPNMSHREPGT